MPNSNQFSAFAPIHQPLDTRRPSLSHLSTGCSFDTCIAATDYLPRGVTLTATRHKSTCPPDCTGFEVVCNGRNAGR